MRAGAGMLVPVDVDSSRADRPDTTTRFCQHGAQGGGSIICRGSGAAVGTDFTGQKNGHHQRPDGEAE